MSKVVVLVQFHVVRMVSAPSLRNRAKGRRLTKKATLTASFTCRRAQEFSCFLGVKVVSSGWANKVKMIRREEVIIKGVGCIATTWICTKSFWFLRPTDELLSFRSRAGEPRGLTGVAKISRFRCGRASPGG